MLKVRLQRVGRKNDPSFRLVVMDSRKDSQSGKFIEILGAYNARQGKPQLNGERIKYWMGVGAQVSPTVHNLLISEKIISGKKINVLPRKSPPKKAPTEVEVVVPTPEGVGKEAQAETTPAEEVKAEAVVETPVA